MLGFQHADLNFPPEFHSHDESQDLGTTSGAAGASTGGMGSATGASAGPMNGGWPSCAQHNMHGNNSNPVTSTTGKKSSESKSSKKNESANSATKKKKTRQVILNLSSKLLNSIHVVST